MHGGASGTECRYAFGSIDCCFDILIVEFGVQQRKTSEATIEGVWTGEVCEEAKTLEEWHYKPTLGMSCPHPLFKLNFHLGNMSGGTNRQPRHFKIL